MNFSSQGKTENVGSKYLKPGVNLTKILGFSAGTTPNNNPVLIISAGTSETEKVEDATSVRLVFSEKSSDISMGKLIHLVTKMVSREKLDAIVSDSMESYAIQLTNLLKNKLVWVNFDGREYMGQDGTVKTAVDLGLPVFAETYENGQTEPKTLVFNANTQIRKLISPSTNSLNSALTSKSESDDLPF